MYYQYFFAIALSFFSSCLYAQNTQWEVDVLGAKLDGFSEVYGIGVAYIISPRWRVRSTYTQLNYGSQTKFNDILDFSEDLNQKHLGIELNWFPSKKYGFYTTAGAKYINGDNQLRADYSNADATTVLGGLRVDEFNRSITGKVKNENIVPYIALGYQHDFSKKDKRGWFMQAEIGKIFNLNPSVTLNASIDTAVNETRNNTFRQFLNEQETSLQQGIDDFYTSYGLSFGYHF